MNTLSTREILEKGVPKDMIKEVSMSAEMREIMRLICHMSSEPVNQPSEEIYKMMVHYVCNQIKQLAHEHQRRIGYWK